MVRVRNLVLAIAAATALTSEMAYALGLGEVTLKSSLNQPLAAEIELLDAKSLAPGEVVPALASAVDFNKAGVDRLYFLSDLKFTPVVKPNGKSVIQVTSSKPVREPYLNFLVEVTWPNGRLLREYTLLLDPPLYSPETAAAAAPQLPITPAQRPAAAARPAPASTSAGAGAGGADASGEYRTTPRDTLWEIAERNRQGGTVHQAMLAIQDLNPDAFIGGNINRMKSGQVLRLPSAEQVRQRSQAEAIAQVAAQNGAWRQAAGAAGPSARQIDATQRDVAGASPARSEAGDSLRLVAPEAGSSTSGGDRGTANGDAKALNDKLAVTQESLDSSRRENAELKDRLQDLQGQLDKLQRLMALKDDQLAKLQAQLAADGSGQAAPVESASEASEPLAAAPAEAPAADAAPGEQPTATTEAVRADPVPEVAPKVAEPKEATRPVKQVPPPAVEPEDEGFVASLLANPVMLGLAGGGALLLLLVGLMALSRRNAMKEAELQESLSADDTFISYEVDGAAAAPAYTHELPDDQVEPETEQKQPITAQSGDPLAEADIYIAYGRFNQAAELLQNALNNEPQRADLRLKLMEVYAELGDREGFARQEAELREIGGSSAEIERLHSKFPAIAAASAGLVGAAAATPHLDDLSLDDLDFGADDSVPPPASNGASSEFDLDLDLDNLGLGLDAEQPRSGEPAKGGFTEISEPDALNLDDDFSFDTPTPTDAAAAEETDSLAFDLESAEEEVAVTSSAETDPLADFDFNFEEVAPGTEEPSPAAESAGANSDELDDFTFALPDDGAEPKADLPEDFDLSLEEPGFAESLDAEELSAELGSVEAELDQLGQELASAEPAAALPADLDDDFGFLADADETATKLDLAKAYIDMGDSEGARDILDEVMSEGNDSQQQEARDMLARLG